MRPGDIVTVTQCQRVRRDRERIVFSQQRRLVRFPVAQITPTATGASGNQTQFQVSWMGNANVARGGLTVTLPEGQQLVSRVYGLAYLDSATGNSVMFATLRDTQGQLEGNNAVIYTNAFFGMRRPDLEYQYDVYKELSKTLCFGRNHLIPRPLPT